MTGDLREFKQDYDWREAFAIAMECGVDVVHGETCSAEPFSIEDVVEVVALVDGVNDEESWIGVFELRDGRFVFISSWCDYTGWDCQAEGHAHVASSLIRLIQFGLGAEDRLRLNL